ncbi:hypothetical protein GOODEAATRI_001182, partial [Goodea atripinnis]
PPLSVPWLLSLVLRCCAALGVAGGACWKQPELEGNGPNKSSSCPCLFPPKTTGQPGSLLLHCLAKDSVVNPFVVVCFFNRNYALHATISLFLETNKILTISRIDNTVRLNDMRSAVILVTVVMTIGPAINK